MVSYASSSSKALAGGGATKLGSFSATTLPSRPSFAHLPTSSARPFPLVSAILTDSAVAASSSTSDSNKNIWNLFSEADVDLELSELTAISPLDGRYANQVKKLRSAVSEFGLIRYRVFVEVSWLLKLSEIPEITEVPLFSEEAKSILENIATSFSVADGLAVKGVERVTNHDVKAVEYILKDKCRLHPELEKVLEFIHFACTSEDINNLAHGLMLQHAMHTAILPAMEQVIKSLRSLSHEYAGIAMLSRTHGQPASPTTLGKEMANFCYRLQQQWIKVSSIKYGGKIAGAVGNYNAHVVAYPDVKWEGIAEEFVTSLGLDFNPYVTQIEPHDYIAELFDAISRFNNILLAFDRDVWSYISIGYFKQAMLQMLNLIVSKVCLGILTDGVLGKELHLNRLNLIVSKVCLGILIDGVLGKECKLDTQ